MTRPTSPTDAARPLAAAQDALETIRSVLEAHRDEAADLRGRLADAEREAERAGALVQRLQEDLQLASETAAESADQVRALTDEARSLKEELLFAQREAAALRSAGRPAAPPRRSSPPGDSPAEALHAPEAAARPLDDPLADAFRAWCHRSSALNDNLALFSPFLQAALPDAHVRAVHRDADSPARPVVLTEAPSGSSAVVYWVVSHDGRHRLLPQPMGPHQFRELAPCFTGDAAPAALSDVAPAEIRLTAGGFELVQPGRVG